MTAMPRETFSNTRARSRSRSPHRHDRPHKRSRHHSPPPRQMPRPLPFSAQPISKHDLSRLRPLLALYLDIQKTIDIEDIEEGEVKGRWKSFVKKWNAGDLAEGWYEPNTLQKALNAARDHEPAHKGTDGRQAAQEDDKTQDEEEEDFGPALPSGEGGTYARHPTHRMAGAAIPSVDELRARREEAEEDAHSTRQLQLEALHTSRRLDRKTQKERLDDLVPRADAGTRERQLEKKRNLATSNKSFANAATEGGDVELPESDVMGEDGVSEFKRLKQHEERKKNDRELRREEVLRARRAEREEKVRVLREKEEKTMAYLKEIARERFGR